MQEVGYLTGDQPREQTARKAGVRARHLRNEDNARQRRAHRCRKIAHHAEQHIRLHRTGRQPVRGQRRDGQFRPEPPPQRAEAQNRHKEAARNGRYGAVLGEQVLEREQKDKRLQGHIVLAHKDDQALAPADQQRREQREASGEQQRRQGPPAIRDQRLSGLPIVKPQQGLVVSHAEHPKDGAFQRHDPERGQRRRFEHWVSDQFGKYG